LAEDSVEELLLMALPAVVAILEGLALPHVIEGLPGLKMAAALLIHVPGMPFSKVAPTYFPLMS
jgi:hypothetical protein